MKVASPHTHKLDDRSRQVINLDKELGTKGYRLYDPNNKRVYVSRDVHFEERKSWPRSQEEADVTVKAVPFVILETNMKEEEGNQGGFDTVYSNGDDTSECSTPATPSP